MDYSKLKRDAKFFEGKIREVEGGGYMTTIPLTVIFPKSYLDGTLGVVGDTMLVLGILAYKSGDRYMVENIATRIGFVNSQTSSVTYEGVDYMELSWQPGQVFIESRDLLVDNTLGYPIYNEFTLKAKTPWYMTEVDVAKITRTYKTWADIDLGLPLSILSVAVASRYRVPGKINKQTRELFKKQSDLTTMKSDIIPQLSVAFGTNNTTSRLGGAYFKEGLIAALNDPAKQKETVEEILRN